MLSGTALMSQLFNSPTPAEPWYIASISRLFRSSHWKPPDQFMMYGMRMFGSIQDTFLLEKFDPTKGALPSGAMLNATGPGPCESLKAGRGSPTGAWTDAVARYS